MIEPIIQETGGGVDLITMNGGKLSGVGDVATRLLQSGFNVNSLRTNGLLRDEEWKVMDNNLIEVAKERLVAVQELVSRGLTFNIGNGLGKTILEWETLSDIEEAMVSMSGVTADEDDTPQFDLESMPLPIIHRGFTINIRKLHASRTTGESLDFTTQKLASRRVMEKIEAMFYNGHATRVGASRIFGILNHTDINTGSITASWDNPATTGAQKLTDVLAMIEDLEADNMFGPYVIHLTRAAFTLLGNDYKAASDKTQLQRLSEVPGIDKFLPSTNMTVGTVAMNQMTSDVIDEVIGLQPTIVQWESQGGMMFHYKVLAIMIPRVRATFTNQSGITVLS